MSEQTRFYVKQLDRTHGAPNWAVYERLPHGSVALCLCYSEEVAQRIARLLNAETRLLEDAARDDTGAI